MKLRLPRFSMRFLLAAMLLVGVGLGVVGRELLKARQGARHQRDLIASLSAKGVEIASEKRRGKLTAFESVIELLDGNPPPTKVSQVTLRKGAFDESDISKIAELNGLEYFVDEFGHCTDQGLRALSSNPTLRYVHLERWPGSAKGATELVDGIAPLDTLMLGTTPIDHEFLTAAARLQRLEFLNCNGKGVPADAFQQLIAAPVLKRLDIIDASGLGKGLVLLANHPKLRDLRLGRYRFDDDDPEQFSKLQNIEWLSIDTADFPQGLPRFLSGMKRLKKLALLGRFHAEELFDFLPDSRIESLSLPQIGPTRPNLMASLSKLKSLRSINLPKMVISGEELSALAAIKDLKTLTVSEGTPLDAIASFQAANPKCKVVVMLKNNARAHVDEQGKLVASTKNAKRSAVSSSAPRRNEDQK